jgi:hypothetical protein
VSSVIEENGVEVDLDDSAVFLEQDSILTAEEAGHFFSTEKQFMNEAERRTTVDQVESGWKTVPVQSKGPYAKLRRSLERVSKEVFSNINKGVRVHLLLCDFIAESFLFVSHPSGVIKPI